MTGRQLNIRLDPADRDRLEALAYVRRKPSAALAREIVLAYVTAHESEPGVQGALASRVEHDGSSSSADGVCGVCAAAAVPTEPAAAVTPAVTAFAARRTAVTGPARLAAES